MKKLLIFGMAALLAGCSSAQIVARNAAENEALAGKPQAYRDGWTDGCYAGVYESRSGLTRQKDDEFRRDDTRMASDTQYALGWGDAVRACTIRKSGGSFFYMPAK